MGCIMNAFANTKQMPAPVLELSATPQNHRTNRSLYKWCSLRHFVIIVISNGLRHPCVDESVQPVPTVSWTERTFSNPLFGEAYWDFFNIICLSPGFLSQHPRIPATKHKYKRLCIWEAKQVKKHLDFTGADVLSCIILWRMKSFCPLP